MTYTDLRDAMEIKKLQEKARWVRKKVLDVAVKCGQAHLGGAFSSVELVSALYYTGILNVTPEIANSPDRDRFLYSKGHCPLGLYTILADNGFFAIEQLEKYGTTEMAGHSDYRINGVEMTSGSLGHGLGFGCGIALAGKLDKKDYKTYVLMGDTECNEGSVWEGVMFASAMKLKNLIVIIDNNKFGVQELTENYVGKGYLTEKWQSFNWNVYNCDGHDFESIFWCLNEIKEFDSELPSVIIANTIKGKGVSFMEGNPAWHHGVPKGDELETAREELK